MRSRNHQVSAAFIRMVLVVQPQVSRSSARITRQHGAPHGETRCLLNESGAAQRPPGNPWRLNPQRAVLWGAGGDRRGRGEEDLTNSGPFELSGAHSPRGVLGLEGKKTSSRKLFQWTPERKARPLRASPGGNGLSDSGEGAAATAALAALGSPRLRWEVPAPRPRAPRSRPTRAGSGGSGPGRPGRGKRPAARAHLDPPARR